MSDGVIVTIDMVIEPEQAVGVIAAIPDMFTETKTFPGFRAICVVRHKESANRVLIIEQWAAEADFHAYQAWRNRDGALDRAREALLSLRTEIWPQMVGAAAL